MDTEKVQMKVFSIKVETQDEQRFNHIHEALDNATKGQTFATLLDRFEQPLKVEDRTGELQRRVAELEELLSGAEAARDEALRKVDQMQLEMNGYAEKMTKTELDLEAERNSSSRKVALKEGEVVLHLLPDNLKALDYVCNRESKRRRQNWSRSHVVNHFIWSRFVRGELNGDLLSIPDGDLRRMGISTAAPKPEPKEEKEEITLC